MEGDSLTEFTSENAKEIRKAWELFVSGDDRGLGKVRPEIRESWLRSRQAKVNPSIQRIPTVLAPEELQRRCQKNKCLLDAGRQMFGFLSQVFTAGAFVATLADAEGNLLDTYSPPCRYDKREGINAMPGAGVRENEVGTTPLATALYVDRPIQAYWYENYAEFAHHWAACSAPVHNSCGKVVGALTVGGYQEVAHPRAFELITSAAAFIEDKIKQAEALAHLEVLKRFNRYLLKFPESPLIAMCPHGRILALSPAMAKLMVMQQSPDRLIGRSLCDVPDFRCEGILSLQNSYSCESYQSSLVFPQQEKIYPSTVIPIQSQDGNRAGLVVIASGLRQGSRRQVTKLSWQATHTFSDLIGNASVFSRAVKLAEKAATYDCPVLLEGESGTGKELFAHAIHRASDRAHGPFIALNLSMIPKDIVASELFGYEEGAFSGARRGGSRGKLELAHGGTLFLDELGDMPAELQTGFLRFLEDRQVVPLGGAHPRVVDVRIIAATHVDLKTAVAQGRFRLDLYHRLNLFPIVLPPLRERLEDLPVLVRSLLAREGFADMQISAEVLKIFRRYSWSGNIRELRNVLVRASMVSINQEITPENLPVELRTYQPPSHSREAASHRLEREQVQQALRECGGHISHAAQYLGVHRVTLHRWLRAHGLTREGITQEDSGQKAAAWDDNP